MPKPDYSDLKLLAGITTSGTLSSQTGSVEETIIEVNKDIEALKEFSRLFGDDTPPEVISTLALYRGDKDE